MHMCVYILYVIPYSFSQSHIFAILMFLFSVMLKIFGEKNQNGCCSQNYLYYVNDFFCLSSM